jgi:spore coat protein U-like protein
LFTTSAHTTIWGDGGDGITVPMTFAAGHPTTMYIYARIPANQRPAAGQYHENIEILTMP